MSEILLKLAPLVALAMQLAAGGVPLMVEKRADAGSH